MKPTQTQTLTLALVATVFALGFTIRGGAGPIDPPAGSVGPSMHSLDELFAAGSSAEPRVPGIAAGRAYMTLEGQTQGPITGEDTVEGIFDVIELFDFSNDVDAPRDAASGLPTGKRQHKPISITKRVDKASPLIARALVTNENLPTVEFRFYRPSSRGGGTEQYFTVRLENASLVSIRRGAVGVATSDDMMLTEDVEFVFQRIIWTYEDGGITAEDDWQAPVV